MIFAKPSISDQSGKGNSWSGIIFEDIAGSIYGDITLQEDLTIPNGHTLTIPNDRTLTIPKSTTLTNNGAIQNTGTIKNYGTITGNFPTSDGAVLDQESQTQLVFTNSDGNTISTANYGDTVKITATMSEKETTKSMRSAAVDKVDFYLGSVESGELLDTGDVKESSGEITASIEVTLNDAKWKPNNSPYTITADFGGDATGKLLDSVGTGALTVDKGSLAEPMVSGTYTYNGNPQTINLTGFDSNTMSVTGNTATDAGSYTATVSLNDSTLYQWGGGSTDSLSISWRIGEKAQDAPSAAPELASKTTGSITLKTVSANANGAVAQYSRDGGTSWQDSPDFSGLSAATAYSFTVRYGAIGNYLASPASSTASFTTNAQSGGGSSSGGSSGGNDSPPTPTPTAKESHTILGGTVAVSRGDLQSLANSGKKLNINKDTATMTFDSTALKTILNATSGTVTFGMVPADISQFTGAKALIGDHPVLNFTISQQSSGENVVVPINFGSGSVAVEIKYTPTAAEQNGGLYISYVDSNGNTTMVTMSGYDANKKAVIFSAGHFSTYGVAYKADIPQFTDTSTHWAKTDIEFVVARGLLDGTSASTFSPNTAMTRGMFITALGRMAGIDANSYQSGTAFAPDQRVTRQEMAVFMQNYAKTMGYTVPQTRTAVTFVDNSNIGSWAAEAVKSMQMAGVIMGKDGNKFDPTGTATRAEVSAVLRRYVELVIDPTTAQGLDRNDSGKIVYYENGNLFAGTKTIDGITYHFDTDGICTEIDAVVPVIK